MQSKQWFFFFFFWIQGTIILNFIMVPKGNFQASIHLNLAYFDIPFSSPINVDLLYFFHTCIIIINTEK